jgi:hypothetical protein
MTTFQYRVSPDNPKLVEIRIKYKHAGRPSVWRAYMERQDEKDALWLLGMLQEPQESESMVRE